MSMSMSSSSGWATARSASETPMVAISRRPRSSRRVTIGQAPPSAGGALGGGVDGLGHDLATDGPELAAGDALDDGDGVGTAREPPRPHQVARHQAHDA